MSTARSAALAAPALAGPAARTATLLSSPSSFTYFYSY